MHLGHKMMPTAIIDSLLIWSQSTYFTKKLATLLINLSSKLSQHSSLTRLKPEVVAYCHILEKYTE